MKLVVDLETTVQDLQGNKDNSPFNPKNKIVSIHWRLIDGCSIKEANNAVLFHKQIKERDPLEAFKADLAKADTLIAHNAKFDVLYLLEAGFDLPENIYCTMIGEYIFSRAQRVGLSLKDTAERRDVTRKKSDLVDELFKSGTGFEEMPLETVIEYAEADVLSCAEIYLAQQEELALEENEGLAPVFDLMNEMLEFLCEIERNGIQIDLDELINVERDFEEEKEQLQTDLNEIVQEVMGDTPINLNSGADMSKVVYSREVTDRDYHRNAFRIGVDHRGKTLPPPRMTPNQFASTVKKTTKRVMRTVAYHCEQCNGKGKIQKFKKDGSAWKNLSKCPACGGKGATYMENGKVAGLKLVPTGPQHASINGFKTDKATIGLLISQAKKKDNQTAILFLTKLMRLNAVNTYLDSFVKGIQTYTRPGGLLHANFNQCTTRTGRLSSSNPNFQNQPKGGKFPVRKCVVSRFEKGKILEADFSGLEFRVAGELSRDPQIIEDILSGKDVHKQTACIINQCEVSDVTKDMRQAAKAYTFAPLYGGMGAQEPPHIQQYFKEYFNIYQGLHRWHKQLMDGVLRDGLVRIPSGREFRFLNAKRLRNGRITGATAVVNYPVQSFATGDIVPLACVRALREFKRSNLTSKLVLTVHDSIVVDVYPGELDTVCQILVDAMSGIGVELEKRFNYTPVLPLDIEIAVGENWMELEEISLEQFTQ